MTQGGCSGRSTKQRREDCRVRRRDSWILRPLGSWDVLIHICHCVPEIWSSRAVLNAPPLLDEFNLNLHDF